MKKLLLTLSLLLPMLCEALPPTWNIVPANSSITFIATQNNAPITGEFKSFTGDIKFDPEHLNGNSVKIIVDLASVTDAYSQLSDTLKSADWFNTNVFPKAVFSATEFSKTGDKTYQAKGTLTIRDKTLPVTLNFTQQEYTPTKSVIKGSTILKRTAFGVGQGEWKDTSAVKDDVTVDFVITAVKK